MRHITENVTIEPDILQQEEVPRKLSFGWLSLTLAPRYVKTDATPERESLREEEDTPNNLPKK